MSAYHLAPDQLFREEVHVRVWCNADWLCWGSLGSLIMKHERELSNQLFWGMGHTSCLSQKRLVAQKVEKWSCQETLNTHCSVQERDLALSNEEEPKKEVLVSGHFCLRPHVSTCPSLCGDGADPCTVLSQSAEALCWRELPPSRFVWYERSLDSLCRVLQLCE